MTKKHVTHTHTRAHTQRRGLVQKGRDAVQWLKVAGIVNKRRRLSGVVTKGVWRERGRGFRVQREVVTIK